MKLRQKYIKLILNTRIAAKDQIFVFDVISGTYNLSEQDRSSSCEFTIPDPGHKVGKLLLEKIKQDGGIVTPPELFKELKEDEKTDSSAIANGVTGDELAKVVVNYCRSIGINRIETMAYILASIDHESKMGVYLSEIGGSSMWYDPFYGRGLIQITHQTNYDRFGKYLGQDFVNNKELVSELKWAVPIAVLGMTGLKGAPTFTGRSLSEFINESGTDYYNARKTVNGTDKASHIADIAKRYETRLRAGEFTGGKVDKVTPFAKLTGQLGAASEQSITPGIDDAIKQAQKFSELQVSVRFNEQPPAIYEYVFTGVVLSGTNETILSGQSIDAAITLSTSTKTVRTHRNTSLRMFGEAISKELGIKFDIVESRLSEQIIKQFDQYPGESAYQVLGRMAKRQGYIVRNDSKTLTLEPLLSDVVSYRIAPGDLVDAPKLTENASSNRITGKGLPPIVTGLKRATRIKDFANNTTAAAANFADDQEYINNIQAGLEIGEGFRVTCRVLDNEKLHTLMPGSIVNVPLPGGIAGDYRLKGRSHSVPGGTAQLQLYLPVWVEAKEKDDQNDATSKTVNTNGQINYTPTPGKLTGEFSLPGLTGKFTDSTPVVVNGFITWLSVCKPERRQFLTAEIVKNLINITGMVEEFYKNNYPNQYRSLEVTSGFRDEASNTAAGGVPNSQHVLGKALDVYLAGVDQLSVAAKAIQAFNGGVGKNSAFCHLDSGIKRDWQYN